VVSSSYGPSRVHARDTARELLEVVPLVMCTVAAQLRAAGEMPAPGHFGLLSMLTERPRMVTDLAAIQGVSLPSMSNSISAMVERGWVRRIAPENDRRVAIIEVTGAGRATLDRVARAAEAHLADVLGPLDAASRRRLHDGLTVLRKLFAGRAAATVVARKGRRTTGRRRPSFQ
jgi:DNA-binding MarR family transcriptional regulator